MGPQQQADDPDRCQGLHDDDRPEVERPSGRNEETVCRRTAGDQIAFEPAREIAAGVVFQQRKAVPQRGQQQNERCGNCRTNPRRDTRRPQHPRTITDLRGADESTGMRQFGAEVFPSEKSRATVDFARFLWHFARKGALLRWGITRATPDNARVVLRADTDRRHRRSADSRGMGYGRHCTGFRTIRVRSAGRRLRECAGYERRSGGVRDAVRTRQELPSLELFLSAGVRRTCDVLAQARG